MPKPDNKVTVNVFLDPKDREEFKNLVAIANSTMSGRFAAWAEFECLYLQKHGRPIDIDQLKALTLGVQNDD